MSLRAPLDAALARGGLVLSVSALALAACSSAADPASPAEPTPSGGAEASPVVDEAPEPPKPMPEAPSGPVAEDDGRELTPSDCNALAARYGFTVRSDEMGKLHPNLTSAQRDQARAAIDRAAEQLETGWRNGCMQSLTGKFASEKSVRCALAAKTVAAFDACLNNPGGASP
jgi:hypothetical protein